MAGPATAACGVSLGNCTVAASWAALARGRQHVGIHHIDRRPSPIGGDLVENLGKLPFELVARHVTDVRGAYGIQQVQPRMISTHLAHSNSGPPKACATCIQ